MPTYDVLIVGLGAMGSAAAYELARRGRRVAGFDRWAPPHTLGSTHGRTRIIREAYFEHPLYVPLLRRAYELWAELEREAGRTLFRQTGGLMIGPPGGEIVAGARQSAEEYGIAHEMLSAAEVRRRFPAYAPPDDAVALLERRAGVLFPEACVAAFLELARRHGAELHTNEPVLRWEAHGGGASVMTERGVYRAARVVLAAGAWLPELAPELAPALAVERQHFHWFAPEGGADPRDFGPERCPISLWELAPGRFFATFPDVGDGVKCGTHHEGEVTTPDLVDRTVREDETAQERARLAALMPRAAGTLLDRRVCLYTNTPDHHFAVGAHPRHAAAIVASPCSGHGFKFASVVGEVVAQLASGQPVAFDLAPFDVRRLETAPRLSTDARLAPRDALGAAQPER
jgi:sarcosine oxidase